MLSHLSLNHLGAILISSALLNNFIVTKFLGLCSFFGVSSRISSSVGLGLATTFVLSISASISYILNLFLLDPLDITYLQSFSAILVIALVVQVCEILIRAMNPSFYRAVGVFLPLITSNCIVLAVALIVLRRFESLLEALTYGFGAGLGFFMMLVLLSVVREKIDASPIPKPFQGVSITFIAVAIVAMAFQGFSGISQV